MGTHCCLQIYKLHAKCYRPLPWALIAGIFVGSVGGLDSLMYVEVVQMRV